MKELNKILEWMRTYALNILLASNIVSMLYLSYEVRTMPDMVRQSQYQHDTVTVTRIETAKLDTRGSFVYFEGEMFESLKISEHFTYRTDYPESVWNGWLTYMVSDNGAKYYMWTPERPMSLDSTSIDVKGWFFCDNMQSFSHVNGKEYLQVLYFAAPKN